MHTLKSFSATSNSTSVFENVGIALRSASSRLRERTHAYLIQMESALNNSIHHPVDAMVANEPWLLFSICFSAISSVSLYLSTKSTASNEVFFDKACLILWIACSACMFLSVAYTNSAAMGAVWLSTYLTEFILSLENMLAYHAVFALHRLPTPGRPKGLFWGIGLAMFIRFVFLVVGGALVTGSTVARFTIGGVLAVMGLLTISTLIDSAQQRRAKAFQIASSVCSFSERLIPTTWWAYMSNTREESEEASLILLPGQSKWAIGVPVIVTILAIELCDSFLTMWNTFAVVGQTNSLFITYSSTSFALMTVRSLYLVMTAASTVSVEPRLLHSNIAGGLVTMLVGIQLLATYADIGSKEPSLALSGGIGVIALGLTALNLIGK